MRKQMRTMMMMLPRSAAPLEEAWEELLAKWARTGTGSCGGDLYAGQAQLTFYLQGTEDSSVKKDLCNNFLLNSTFFSLLLSLGLIVALVVVSNRTPAGHMVKKRETQKYNRNATTCFLFRCQVVLQAVQVFA